MALVKEKTVNNYPAEYWKITWVKLDSMDYSLTCELCLYKDQATRNLGRENMVERKVFTWKNPSEFAAISALTALGCFGWAYDKIVESDVTNEKQYDENQNLIVDENGDAVLLAVENNFFADAVAVVE
jgi:hypothetical protein